MAKRLDLSALASAAGSVRARPEPAAQDNTPPPEATRPVRQAVPPSRAGAKPITAFFPAEVRTQLKVLAAEQRRSMESMLAEALNDLFAKHGKPEIAPAADRSRASSH